MACTSIAVGKNLTDTGCVLFAHSEELDITPHRLISIPRKEYSDSDRFIGISGGPEIVQPKMTYAYIAAAVPDKKWYPGDISSGVNEMQVAIANNMSWTREVPTREKGYAWKLADGALIWTEFSQLVLERAKKARAGIDIISHFHEKYALSGDPGTMYMIADPNEAWYIEMAVNGQWIAKRIADDGFHTLANAFTIGVFDFDDPNILYSEDLVRYAIDKGWYKEGDGAFNFKDVYGEPENQKCDANLLRIEMADYFLKDQDRINKQKLMAVLRSAYEGTEKYDPDPVTGSVWDRDTRVMSTLDTDESAVVEFRRDFPVEIGTTIWWTLATSKVSPYIPYYSGALVFPEEYADAGMKEDCSAYWVNRKLTSLVHKHYSRVFGRVKETWDSFEKETFDMQKEIEDKALALTKAKGACAGIEYLNAFSNKRAAIAYKMALDLSSYIEKEFGCQQ